MGCGSSVFEEIPTTHQPLQNQHDQHVQTVIGIPSMPIEESSRNVEPTITNTHSHDSSDNNTADSSKTARTANTNSETVIDEIKNDNQEGDNKTIKTKYEVKQTATSATSAATVDAEEDDDASMTLAGMSSESHSLNPKENGPNSYDNEPKKADANKESYSEPETSGSITRVQTNDDGSSNEKHNVDSDSAHGCETQQSMSTVFDTNIPMHESDQNEIKNADEITCNPDEILHPPTPIQSAEQNFDLKTEHIEKTNAKSVDTTGRPCLQFNDNTDITDKGNTVTPQNMEDLKLNLLNGNVNVVCPKTAKIVRVFLSSTFTDTQNERNLLLGDTYSRLKKQCKTKGYEFQLVDMRWGVVQSIDNSHMTGEMCIKEIDLCQKLSTGPNFVTFLSHKYGYLAYPRSIKLTEFEELAKFISSEKQDSSSESEWDLINKWYLLDENSVPPSYIIQPISTYFPDFMSSDKDVYKKTKKEWNKVCDRIINILFDAAKTASLPSTRDTSFIVGVTDSEIQQGILNNDYCEETCLWLKRDIKGLEDKVGQKYVDRYIDSIDGSAWAERNKTLMNDLVKKLKHKLPKKNTISFTVEWQSQAINPEEYEQHKEYLSDFCINFEKKVFQMFTKALKNSNSKELNDQLLEEIAQHTRLCQEKCRDFCGRNKELGKLKKGVNEMSRTVLVHGKSGSGKTSTMAVLTKKCWSWFDGKAVVITRFVGVTPDSSRVGTLLVSIILQICKSYGKQLHLDPLPTEYDKLCKCFMESIQFATPEKKLFIFLDSFEQLDPLEEAMNFTWIPDPLPDNVKMVISTTSTDKIFLKLKTSLIKSPLIEIKEFTREDATNTFEKWLSQKKRKLTHSQMNIVNKALEICSLPLFVRLTFDEASKWTSYMPESETILQQTTEEAIGNFFSLIEQTHGPKLVAHALGYLTLAKRGLSESELEDILSCADEVLDELYVFWEPPIRRLPPMILVRLRSQLDHYIVHREVEGTPVMFWNHSQFKEVSHRRYCTDETVRQNLYLDLAEFFAGTWAGDKKKPFVRKMRKDDSADASLEDAAERKVAAQPLYFNKQCNIRKVTNLPWYLIATGNSRQLATDCLCNLDFLHAKLKHVGIRSLLNDFVDAVDKFKDEDFKLIKRALQLSQKALQRDVNQLPAQLIARLSEKKLEDSKELCDLLENCHHAVFPVLVSSRTSLEVSEASLSHSLPAHTSKVVGFDLSKSENTAITLCDDGQLKVWDTKLGEQIRLVDVPHDTIDNHTTKPIKCLLVFSDQIILIVTENQIFLYDADTGHQVAKLGFENQLNPPAVCAGGDGKHGSDLKNNIYIGLFFDSVWNLYKSKNLELEIKNKDIGSLERGRLGSKSLCAGSSTHMAVTDEEHFYLRLFSIKDRVAVKSRRIFPQFDVDNNVGDLGYRIQCMTFTPDSTYIIVANMHENDILFLNSHDLNEMKRFKGFSDDSPLAYSVTADGRQVLFPSHQHVVVRDLQNGSDRKLIAKHPCQVVFAATSQFHPLVTVGEDGVLRLWNNFNLSSHASSLENFEEEDSQIRKIELFKSTSRYAVCVEVSPSGRHLSVHDLISGRTVRRARLSHNQKIDKKINIEVAMLNEDEQNVTAIVKLPCGHLYEVDLNKMEIIKELDVQVPVVGDEEYKEKRFTVLKIQEEMHVIALHHSARKIDLLQLSTGEKVKLFHTNGEKIENFMVFERQLILVVEVEQTFTLVDIRGKRVITTYSPDDEVHLLGLSADGKCLILCGQDNEWITCWNSSKGELLPLLDIYNEATDETELHDLAVEHIITLDNETIVCSFKTGTVRICNFITGKTRTLNAGHVGEVTLSCCAEQTVFFLSYGIDAPDQTMVLWSKEGSSVKKVASYSSDNSLEHVQLSQDGTFVISCTQNDASVVTWKLEGKHEYSKITEYCQSSNELFQADDTSLMLDLTCHKDSDAESIESLDDSVPERDIATPDILDDDDDDD